MIIEQEVYVAVVVGLKVGMFLVVYIILLKGWHCDVVVGQWVCQFVCWVWSVVAECVDYLPDFVVVLG